MMCIRNGKGKDDIIYPISTKVRVGFDRLNLFAIPVIADYNGE